MEVLSPLESTSLPPIIVNAWSQTSQHPILCIATLLVAAQVTYYVRTWYRLRMFRGPWLASFSELWLFKAAYTGQMHREILAACEKYGDALIRVGPNELVTCDPEIGRHMSATRLNHHKGQWYASLKVDPYVDNIFSETNPDKHDTLRGWMSAAVSPSPTTAFQENRRGFVPPNIPNRIKNSSL